DPEVIVDPGKKLVVGAQVHRSEDLPVAHDALEQDQVPLLHAGAVGLGQFRKSARGVGPRVGREERPPRVVDGGGAHRRPEPEQAQVLLRHSGVVECQRGSDRAPEQLRLRGHVRYQGPVVGAQVVTDHRGQGDDQSHQRGDEHHPEQLLAQRARGGELHDDFDTTLRATPRRRALIFRLLDSKGGGAMSKRTLSSTTTKLIMLPSSSASSDSVTVNNGWPFAAANMSASRLLSDRPTKRTCKRATASPGRSLRTVTGRPLIVRPATIRASSSARASAPITPIAIGLSGFAKTPCGHST